MGNKLPAVGPLELEVLGVLNTTNDLGVSDIQASLKQGGNELAYTTVMTVLVRLHNKGLVTRQKDGRQFLYSASKKKDLSPLKLFERFKTSLFGSEKLKPILGLLDSDDELSKDELEELKKAVETKLKRLR
jgi:BlaI family penicillinase repressor